MRRRSRSRNIKQKSVKDLIKGNDADGLQRQPSLYVRRSNFIKEYLIDYSTNSNLHGLKYIGEKERTIIEKIYWLLMFLCCVVFCTGLIMRVWLKWKENPEIVTVSGNPRPIWQIPYPAVTVCLQTKAMQRKFNYTEYYHLYYYNETFSKLTEEERNLFEDVSMVCDAHLAPLQGRKFSSGLDIVNNIKAVSPSFNEAFVGCKWKDIPSQNCTDLFSPIITEEGLCYTFNTLAADELFRIENLHHEYPYLEHEKRARSWTIDDGYGMWEPLETYPNRGSGHGVMSGLVFLLKAYEDDLDYLCKGPVQGFKISLHNPAELPRLSQQYFRSSLSQEVIIAVKPNVMTTSEGLQSYDPISRHCYFPTERILRYFKVYTQANCEMECLSNFTYTRCGCVNFGMPRGPNMTVCNSGSMQCMKIAEMEVIAIEYALNIGLATGGIGGDKLPDVLEVTSKCQCLPSCTSIEYEAETSQADFDWRAIYRAYRINFTQEYKEKYFSRVLVFFKEAQFISSKRVELDSQTFKYTGTDLLADCGGLLGLFMGFSLLSLAEIIYFLTLRLYCKYLRFRSQKKIRAALEKDIEHTRDGGKESRCEQENDDNNHTQEGTKERSCQHLRT